MTSVLHGLGPLLSAVAWTVLAFFAAVNTLYAVQLVAAVAELRRNTHRSAPEDRLRLLSSPVAPRVTILAPAYNEEATVRESVQALLTLQFPNLEVVLVNDGSADATLAVLREAFSLAPVHPVYWRRIATARVRGIYYSAMHPHLVVVDKENGGKADALNSALNVATGELVCAIDADTIIEGDALLRISRPFLADDRVIASGGTIRVVNGSTVSGGRVSRPRVPRTLLAGIQSVEYLRAFLFGRLAWNRLGGNLIISGAFGLFRRESVTAAGGYLHDTVGEDMELVARLRRQARERGESDPGGVRPRPGGPRGGRRALRAPAVPRDLRLRDGAYRCHAADERDVPRHYGTALDRPLLILWALLENLGYRQLTGFWRLRGLWKFARKRKDWGTMTRRTFSSPPSSAHRPPTLR